MSGGIDDLRAVLEAVHIDSPTCYRIDGVAREVPAPEQVDDVLAVPLVQQLEREMYSTQYCQWATAERRGPDELGDRELVHALSAANAGHGTWEPGWIVAGPEEDGRIPMRKDGLTLWAQPNQVRNRGLDAQGRGPGRRPGTPSRVRVGKELREIMQGFYFAIGDGDETEERDADEKMVRLYWHVDRDGAADLIRVITTSLNPMRVPFRAKVVNFSAGYPRCDAGVLYLDRRYFPRVASVLPRMHAELAERLGAEVPRFTKPLGPGLGLAEDPENDESFGQHRCRLVVAALWAAFRDGVEEAARLGRVCRAFERVGLDPAHPYLQPGSQDDYGTIAGGIEFAGDSTPIRGGGAARSRPRITDDQRARKKQERRCRKASRRK